MQSFSTRALQAALSLSTADARLAVVARKQASKQAHKMQKQQLQVYQQRHQPRETGHQPRETEASWFSCFPSSLCLALQLHAPLSADSIKDVAVNTTLKLLHYLNRTDVPIAVSTLQPRNAFPMLYRAGPLAADVLPALNPPDLQLEALRSKVVSKQAGQDAMTQLLLKQKEPVTIIATGRCDSVMGVWQCNGV